MSVGRARPMEARWADDGSHAEGERAKGTREQRAAGREANESCRRGVENSGCAEVRREGREAGRQDGCDGGGLAARNVAAVRPADARRPSETSAGVWPSQRAPLDRLAVHGQRRDAREKQQAVMVCSLFELSAKGLLRVESARCVRRRRRRRCWRPRAWLGLPGVAGRPVGARSPPSSRCPFERRGKTMYGEGGRGGVQAQRRPGGRPPRGYADERAEGVQGKRQENV